MNARGAACLIALAIGGNASLAAAQPIEPSPPFVQSAPPGSRCGFRCGIIAVGTGLFLSNYALAVGLGASGRGDSQELFVPIAGPGMLLVKRSCQDCGMSTIGETLVTLDGVSQVAGLVVLLAGLVYPAIADTANPNWKQPAVVAMPGGTGIAFSF